MQHATIIPLPVKSALLTLLLIMSLPGCEPDVVPWPTDADKQVITEYILDNPDHFSEFGAALQRTGIDNLLKVRGPFTLLLPTDEAMREYYAQLGVSSSDQLDEATLRMLIYNHILTIRITSGSIGLGALPDTNVNGDYIVSEYIGPDIFLNKTTLIERRDIIASNGVIHIIDKVIPPYTADIYEVLASFGGYEIFVAGLEKAGLKDTLKLISFLYGKTIARTRFTLLAVPDTLYQRFGIHSVNDLVALYSDSDNLKDPGNGFYQYMEYHCLKDAHFLNNFDKAVKPYYILSHNNFLIIQAEEDFKINKDSANSYTGFYIPLCNIPARNGVFHTINSTLPAVESDPVMVIMETTDFFDLKQGHYYQRHYARFYDGQNTFEKIKWEGDNYLLYYYKPTSAAQPIQGEGKADCLTIDGQFWIEITFPKLRKGKYMMSFNTFPDGPLLNVYVNGVKHPNIYNARGKSSAVDVTVDVGEVEFLTTDEVKIRVETITTGKLFWDYVKFTPIK